MDEIKERIKHARKSKGLSLEEAAEICETSPSTWMKWEAGHRTPLSLTVDGIEFRLGKVKAKKKKSSRG